MRVELLAHGAFAAAAFFSAAVTVLVFGFMAVLGLPVIQEGQLLQIFWGPWSPDHLSFGIRPMILGTLCIALFGLVTAVPLSLGCAAFITVTAPKGPARFVHRLIRLMTGIPTVIYGFVGIFMLVPLVREIGGRGSGMSILTAGLLLAVLVSPTMILFFSNGLSAVPKIYCHAVTALGGTQVQCLMYVMLPQAWRSILAGVALGFGRAVGDTMIALMLAGNAVAPPDTILDAARTLTAHIALIIAADFDSLEFRTLYICGLTLYLTTSLAVIVMRWVAQKQKGAP